MEERIERIPLSEDDEQSVTKVAFSFLEHTSAHGLPRVATERTIARRVTWSVIFVTAFCYFLYQFSNRWKYYNTHPVGVKTGVARRKFFAFPAVTVCNSNILKRTLLTDTNYSSLLDADKDAMETLQELLNTNTTSRKRRSITDRSRDNDTLHATRSRWRREAGDEDYYETTSMLDDDAICDMMNQRLCDLSDDEYDKAVSLSITPDMSDIRELVKPSWQELEELGYTAEEFIGQCSFDNNPCFASNFSVIRDSEYGNCFVFNSVIHGQKVLRRTNKVGLRYGLRLTLSVSQEEYIGLLAHEAGVRVAVHSPWVHPFPNDKGVSAGVGLKTQIGTRLTKQTRLPAPYPTECSNGENIKLAYPGNYTVLACASTCRRDYIKEHCGCFPKAIKSTDTRLCRTRDEEYCMASIIRALDNGTLKCDCRPACDEEAYTMTVSSVPWPSEAYAPYVETRGISEGWLVASMLNWYMNRDLVRLHIFVEEADVMTIDEYPAYTWDGLLADTGGYLGLFIGVSVCTVLEMFEFLFDLIIFLVSWRLKRKQVSNKETAWSATKAPPSWASASTPKRSDVCSKDVVLTDE